MFGAFQFGESYFAQAPNVDPDSLVHLDDSSASMRTLHARATVRILNDRATQRTLRERRTVKETDPP